MLRLQKTSLDCTFSVAGPHAAEKTTGRTGEGMQFDVWIVPKGPSFCSKKKGTLKLATYCIWESQPSYHMTSSHVVLCYPLVSDTVRICIHRGTRCIKHVMVDDDWTYFKNMTWRWWDDGHHWTIEAICKLHVSYIYKLPSGNLT